MWYILLFLLSINFQVGLNASNNHLKKKSTKPIGPQEAKITTKRIAGADFCPFGEILYPAKSCKSQIECQTTMNINGYCSEKEICCQEQPHKYDSLCYEKRLPLFGEQECEIGSDCDNRGALCKSNHCCPDFHSIPNQSFRPPSHFYSSNFSCVPGKPIPPGFRFAYCSNITSTIAYLGIVNKCGEIQHINRYSKCKKDSDCFPGNICIWTIDEGMCFRNPEDCSKGSWFYVSIVFCYLSFVFMLLYFLTRTCYENPEKMNETFPKLSLQLYDITEKAESNENDEYGEDAAEKIWEEDEKSMKKPALEHILNRFGYVIDYSDDDSDEENDQGDLYY